MRGWETAKEISTLVLNVNECLIKNLIPCNTFNYYSLLLQRKCQYLSPQICHRTTLYDELFITVVHTFTKTK